VELEKINYHRLKPEAWRTSVTEAEEITAAAQERSQTAGQINPAMRLDQTLFC